MCNNYLVDSDCSEALLEDKEKLEANLYNLPLDKYCSMFPFSVSAFDYIDQNSLVIMDNDMRALNKLDHILSEYGVMMEKLLIGKKILHSGMTLLTDFFEAAKTHTVSLVLPDILGYDINFRPAIEFNFLTRENTAYRGRMELLLEDINKWRVHDRTIVLFTPTKKSGKILNEYLNDHNIYADHVSDLNEKDELSNITIVDKGIFEGFEFLDAKLCIVGSGKIFRKSAKESSNEKVAVILTYLPH